MSKTFLHSSKQLLETKAISASSDAQRLKAKRCRDLQIRINGKFQAMEPYNKGILERSDFIVRNSRNYSRILTRAYGEAAAEVLTEIAILIPQIRAARAAGGIIRYFSRLSNSVGSLTATVGRTSDARRSARKIIIEIENAKKDVRFFQQQKLKLRNEIERLQDQQKRLGCSR